jgi:hypothetical protein
LTLVSVSEVYGPNVTGPNDYKASGAKIYRVNATEPGVATSGSATTTLATAYGSTTSSGSNLATSSSSSATTSGAVDNSGSTTEVLFQVSFATSTFVRNIVFVAIAVAVLYV